MNPIILQALQNPQNFQMPQKPKEVKQETSVFDLIRIAYDFGKFYYRDVYWDNSVQRFRNSDGEFVSDWKGRLFT